VARYRREQSSLIRSARRGSNDWLSHEEGFVFIIGIDPHKGSHTAAVLDGTESAIAELRRSGCSASGSCVRPSSRWRSCWTKGLDGGDRVWAIESAGGLGYLLAQQFVAAGESVVDIPATLASRVRLLGTRRSD
jgi:hypothetical protein